METVTREAALLDPAIGEQDLHLFHEGTHLRAYQKLGAHLAMVGGTSGVSFAVWAPNASSVSVIGEWNGWQKGRHTLLPVGQSGLWQAFLPGVQAGARYKFHLVSRLGGYEVDKADPYGNYHETAASHRVGGVGPGLRLGRRRVDGRARAAERARRAHLHLRGAPRFLEALARGPDEFLGYRDAGAAPGRLLPAEWASPTSS